MKAPDKIYVDDLAVVNDCVTKISLKQLPNFSEYIRKDALMEWAKAELGELIDGLREEINRELSLPSNLDKAAENYYENDCPYDGEARVVNGEHDVWFPSQAIEDTFKAGAEWMARQGVNIHGRVLPGTHGNSYVESDWFDKGYGGLSWNDEVDLIIRKKQ